MKGLESAICQHILDYLAGDTTIEEFTDWFVGATWAIDQTGTPAARELAHAVDLALMETSNGLWSIDELRAQLRELSQLGDLNLTPAQEVG